MIEAPLLKKNDFPNAETFYRRRDALWHLQELAEIVRASRQGRRVNVRANLGMAVKP